MPLNELEKHPFLNYFFSFHRPFNVPWSRYTKMFIGSFPVYEITSTIFPVNQPVHRWQGGGIAMPFFYGSETNKFWERLAHTFEIDDPQNQPPGVERKDAAIRLLEEKKIILTDTIKRTNRYKVENQIPKPFSPADNALFNNLGLRVRNHFKLNNALVKWLIKAENINSIYFTAQKSFRGKNPGGWFFKILIDNGIQYEILEEAANAIRLRISNLGKRFDRIITLFFLPTPSGYRTICLTPDNQHDMFVNYLESAYPDFYQLISVQNFQLDPPQKDILQNYREEFINLWWHQFLIEENWEFDGTVIHQAV